MTNNNVLRKNLIGGLTFGFFVASLFFFTFGCSDKKKSGGGGYNNAYYGNYNYGRPGYNGQGHVTRVGAAHDQSGQYMVILAIANGGTNGMQNGTAIVDGEFRVYNHLTCPYGNGYLSVPAGVYQLIPYNNTANAYFQLDLLQGAQFVARGNGIEALVSVPYAHLSRMNYCGYEGMLGSLEVVSVNGYNCRLYTGFTDQYGATCR